MENVDITLDSIEISNVSSVLTGPQGPAGFSPIATVTKTDGTATITITDENGTTTAQVSDGTDGTDGQNNTLTIGTVTSGVTADATITGDSPNQVLNLVLPKGDTGEDGADGTTPTITIGNTTTVSPDTPASVTNSGTSTAVVLNFDIPRGVQGDTSGCLSTPTVVSSLPATGDTNTFYFVPKTYVSTNVSGTSITLTITDNSGRFSKFDLLGNTVQDTVPDDPESLTGVITLTINGTNYTIDLGQEYLAKVTTHQDYIYNDGENWYIHREIGYISNYSGETITTDYICTSGTLTNGDVVYYVLDDSEEIEITNAALLVGLNLIKTMVLSNGTITITSSANVPATMDVSYYSFDINNQYDKYVYLIETGNYERVG